MLRTLSPAGPAPVDDEFPDVTDPNEPDLPGPTYPLTPMPEGF